MYSIVFSLMIRIPSDDTSIIFLNLFFCYWFYKNWRTTTLFEYENPITMKRSIAIWFPFTKSLGSLIKSWLYFYKRIMPYLVAMVSRILALSWMNVNKIKSVIKSTILISYSSKSYHSNVVMVSLVCSKSTTLVIILNMKRIYAGYIVVVNEEFFRYDR